jgi:putative pyruvate formate lyase activating enzyme
MTICHLCPRNCRVRRIFGETGDCGLANNLLVHSYGLSHNQENVLSGTNGSGAIFFSGCELNCFYCSNYEISRLQRGHVIHAKELADMMLQLQKHGAHNINLVTPTPQVLGIVEALSLAFNKGLSIPIVYNTGGYDSVETLKLLDGLIDIYLPDAKYGGDNRGNASGVGNYTTVNRATMLEMKRQVGDLVVDEHGRALRGLMVRHLILPNSFADTETVLNWIASNLGTRTYVSLMPHYFPQWEAKRKPFWNRRISAEEYTRLLDYKYRLGLLRGYDQADEW